MAKANTRVRSLDKVVCREPAVGSYHSQIGKVITNVHSARYRLERALKMAEDRHTEYLRERKVG